MNYDIQIANYKVSYLLDCEIRKSANKLTDIATIKLNGMAYSKTVNIEDKIKRGDKVSIKLGYDSNLYNEFNGYIKSIKTDDTIIIECEDSMFLMRKEVKSKQYKNITASDIIKDLLSQIGGFDLVLGDGVSDLKYDKFTISNATAFDVLTKLKEETGAHIFVKGNELNFHLKYTYKEGDVVYDFSKNVEKSSLKYVKSEDKKVLIEIIGINRNNEKTKVEVGEKGGDKITVHRYNVNDKSALEAIGQEELKKYRYTGYEGDITGWLTPYCSYGYSCRIIDSDYPIREAIYYCEAVTTQFNSTGGKRKITLGIKLA
jgi:phosphotransferase system IIA component